MATTIQIQDRTWEELNKRKKRGETFDDVIKKALLEIPEVKRK
jgi:predicted CopG family antitoxin